jgi:hypothetical protein
MLELFQIHFRILAGLLTERSVAERSGTVYIYPFKGFMETRFSCKPP